MNLGPVWSVLLAAGAVLVLWWPPNAAESRLGRIGEAVVRRRHRGGAMAVVCATVGVAFVVGGTAVGAAVAIATAVGSWWRRRRVDEQAEAQQLGELVLALSLMIAELSVGAPPVRACAVAVAELRRRSPDGSEVADGLERMGARAELGGGVTSSRPVGGPQPVSWQRIGDAWQTADRHGLPMGELLTALRTDLLARRGFIERTRAGLAGPRATALVLAGLPLLGIALGQATGAQPLAVLLGGGIGGVLLSVGAALVGAGLVWSERLTAKVLTP